jgi:hypothetical protein
MRSRIYCCVVAAALSLMLSTGAEAQVSDVGWSAGPVSGSPFCDFSNPWSTTTTEYVINFTHQITCDGNTQVLNQYSQQVFYTSSCGGFLPNCEGGAHVEKYDGGAYWEVVVYVSLNRRDYVASEFMCSPWGYTTTQTFEKQYCGGGE